MDNGVEFQGLVLKHLDSLYNYALVLTRRSEDAEDLLQDVLVRGFQGFSGYDRSLSFKGWMFTIIKHAQLVGAVQGSLLALLLSVGSRPFYASYAAGRGASSLAPLEDQVWGGIVMWAGGGAVDMLAVLVLVWRFLAASEHGAPAETASAPRPAPAPEFSPRAGSRASIRDRGPDGGGATQSVCWLWRCA